MDLTNRDAFTDTVAVKSDLIASTGHDAERPLVTIAIPTYHRPDKLVQVVKSAIAQRFDRPFEVIVVDNDIDQNASRIVMDGISDSGTQPVRYYANRNNIGMFGNWNRCITLARGRWVTILNDDDLLLPNFLERSFRVIDKNANIDGLVCKKLDYNWDTGRLAQPWARRAAKWLLFRWRFNLSNLLRVDTRKLFFGNELDNGLGFLFKKDIALRMGGYRQDEFPASDFFFYIRFCIDHNLYWLNESLAYLGIGENESVNLSTINASIALAGQYYQTMTDGYVPSEWSALRPQLTANQVEAYRRRFGIVFDPEARAAIEKDMGAKLPRPNYGRIRRFRLFHGGY